MPAIQLIEKLAANRSLALDEYELIVSSANEETTACAAQLAASTAQSVYGKEIFIRGLIEIGNHCANDCLYCGIRRSNKSLKRYRLSSEHIIECARKGYDLGFRTFVLQGGEDAGLSDEALCNTISSIKANHPDCAITLSVGERTRESYQRLFEAGADRYLLRHETACPKHYAKLHPRKMSHSARLQCIADLREVGYAVGVGFMVGSPHQTPRELALDLKFVEKVQPAMCGIGPFVAHHATPFANEPCGSVGLTCYMLSLLRLIKPNLLLPATTAISTLDAKGYEKGVLSGANVMMPNLSPASTRKLYDLYDNKMRADGESDAWLAQLKARVDAIGYSIVVDRGDARPEGECYDGE